MDLYRRIIYRKIFCPLQTPFWNSDHALTSQITMKKTWRRPGNVNRESNGSHSNSSGAEISPNLGLIFFFQPRFPLTFPPSQSLEWAKSLLSLMQLVSQWILDSTFFFLLIYYVSFTSCSWNCARPCASSRDLQVWKRKETRGIFLIVRIWDSSNGALSQYSSAIFKGLSMSKAQK